MLLSLLFLVQSQVIVPSDQSAADAAMNAALRSLCPSAEAGNRDALLATEERLSAAAQTANTPDAWLALGCTRALLSGTKGSSRSGVLMLPGDSWAQGAISTVVKVLELRPGDRAAADILAVYAMDESDNKATAKAVTRLEQAVTAGADGIATMRACSQLGMRVGRADLARRCAEASLRAGHDSVEQLLVLARLGARDHDTTRATGAFVRAASAAHDGEGRAAVFWHFQWFITPDERQVWPSLSDSALGVWVRDRLSSRDVRDGQPLGARLMEHFRRLEYADSAFRLHVARRMRNTMLTGPSAMRMNTDPLFPDAWRDYSRWQLDLDDRGAVWMRFGAPNKRYTKNSFEVWRYDLDGTPMVLTFAYEPFSGQTGASRLVSGLISDIYCGIDTWRCVSNMRQRIPVELRQRVREQDREYIREATTKDDNSPRGDKPIELQAHLNRVWDVTTGGPLVVVTYAVKASDLATQKAPDNMRTTVVDFNLRRWDAITGGWQDTSFSHHLRIPDSSVRKGRVTGYFVSASLPNITTWSMVATQPDHRRGRMWDEKTPALDRGPVAFSDLILGQEGQGAAWKYHGNDIPLAPLNAVDGKRPVSLYYQVRSDQERTGMRTSIAVYRMEQGAPRETPALQVAAAQPLHAGVNEALRVVDVSLLEHGTYLLEVQLMDAGGRVLTRRSVVLNVD